jgi:FMN phosphatase YigB (HAD superfamily)
MKFCFDLDETLVRGDVITQASRILAAEGKIDRIFTGKDVTSWDLDGIPECVKEKSYELFEDAWFAVWNKKPIVGVETFLDYLLVRGHDLYIITARPKKLHEDTIRFMKERFKGHKFVNIICVDGSNNSKIIELAKLNPDYYFDDNITYCEEARLLGINTYMISNEHTPWNHHICHHDITRIKNVSFFPFESI